MKSTTHYLHRYTALLAILIGTLCLIPSFVYAHTFKLGTLHIDHPYTVATVTGQTVGGVFFKAIDNQGSTADYLISAKVDSSIATHTELHVMNTEHDIMRMRKLKNIELPAKTVVPMTRGLNTLGYHIMLMGLKKPLLVGETFNLTLKFKRAGTVKVVVYIEEPAPNNKGNASKLDAPNQHADHAAHMHH